MKEHRSKVLFSSLQDLSVWTMVLDPLFRNIESEFLMVDPRNWYFIINFEQFKGQDSYNLELLLSILSYIRITLFTYVEHF